MNRYKVPRTCPLPVTACQSPVLRSSLSCRAPDGAQSAEGAGLRLAWISPPVNLVRALQVDGQLFRAVVGWAHISNAHSKIRGSPLKVLCN